MDKKHHPSQADLMHHLSKYYWPDLINVFKGQPTAPLPVIIIGLGTMGLFYYGPKIQPASHSLYEPMGFNF